MFDWNKLDPASAPDPSATSTVGPGGGGIGGEGVSAAGGSAGGGDAGGTGGAGGAGGQGGMPLGPWGTAVAVPSLAHVEDDDDPTATADGLELFFNSNRDGPDKIWRATRSAPSEDWGAPSPVDVLGTQITNPTVSPDGLTIWFQTYRDGLGYAETWVASRGSRGVEFDAPARADDLNVSGEASGEISGATDDGLLLLTSRSRTFYYRTRSATSELWSDEMATVGLNDPLAEEQEPHLSPDGLVVYFSSDRLDIGEDHLLFRTERTTLNTPWAVPELVQGLPAGLHYTDPWVSPDERYIMFTLEILGEGREIFEARR